MADFCDKPWSLFLIMLTVNGDDYDDNGYDDDDDDDFCGTIFIKEEA